ncbi:MAG: hypothetical protein BMS9Abin10_0568 [Gammaproteobacteria bacterium]|nr:MAG: hypothetical protein BMS9Abin10_0568 [Gammaproteobacteria bacterium]
MSLAQIKDAEARESMPSQTLGVNSLIPLDLEGVLGAADRHVSGN